MQDMIRQPARRAVGAALAALWAALLVLVAASPPAAAQPDGDLVVERFHAHLDVRTDGAVAIVEEIEVDFGAVEHHGIVRALPVRFDLDADDEQVHLPEGRSTGDYRRVVRVGGISVTATAPGDVETSTEGDALVLRIGDPDVTVTGQQSYRLAYTVEGALNAFDDRAELTWDVTGGDWDGPILVTTATVDVPGVVDAACYEGPEGTTAPCADLDIGAERVEAAAEVLEPGEDLTVSVGVPPDAVAVPAPLLEERWRLSRALAGDPVALPLTAVTTLLALVGLGLLARRWRSGGAAPNAVPAAGRGVSGAPPAGLRPAQVRLLVEGRVDDAALGATLFDLGARGHLEIEDLAELAGDGEGDGYRLRRIAGDETDLLRYERLVLASLFEGGEEARTDDLGEGFVAAQSEFRAAVEEDALDRGWFPERPSRARARRGAIAAGLGAAGAVLAGVALAFTEVALAAIPLLLAAAVAGALVARRPIRTEEGERLAAEARAFRRYLADAAEVDAGMEQEPAALFGRYLPYAIALGAAPAWVARFERLPVSVEVWAPAYFLSSTALLDRDPAGFTSSVSGLTSHVGGSSTAPSTSTSSGGGAVGGGFGGGGGGGW